MKAYDPSAIGSDIPRTFQQYLARTFAKFLIRLSGLNRPNFLSTEIVQQIYPVCSIPTKFGVIRCKCGHGRLRWRATTFYTEEPETIKWLDSLAQDDLLWDIGSNVGLYAIYAAKKTGCRVLAVEPESQNYAILIENIALNNLQDYIGATNFAITSKFCVGRLEVHDITKGGAYNQFLPGISPGKNKNGVPISQLQIGVSLNDLVSRFNLPVPTHVKIDVDGNEPDIIAGAGEVLKHNRCRSILMEIQRDDPQSLAIVDKLKEYGFRILSQRSNWESRSNRAREKEHPAINIIFIKD